MADFLTIQDKIYYGYGKAAERLGSDHAIYRSPDGIDPLLPGNYLFDQLISVDQNFLYTSPKKYGDLVWQFLPENGLLLQNYDFMVGGGTTYFIADVAPYSRLSPPLCVECNAVISLYSMENTLTPGDNGYQEYGEGAAKLSNCPALILEYTRMDNAGMGTPTTVKMPTYNITVPIFNNMVIKTGDLIIDDKGRRLVVIVAEQTKKSLGLRIIAQERAI